MANFNISELLKAARGGPVETLLTNGRVVDLFTGRIHTEPVAISQGHIVGFGDYKARETIDLEGRYLVPGLIDSHMHVESSLVTPSQYARAVVPRGTTTIITDPHEIANVCGLKGVEFMLADSEDTPLDMLVMAPSCVPATDMETSGAVLEAEQLAKLSHPRVIGLAEMMNFPGVIHGDPRVLAKLESAIGRLDGHAPKVSGKDLFAYTVAGIESDHECTTPEEALEKLSVGLYLMIREGSITKDLVNLLPAVNHRTLSRCLLCTDDREPRDLIDEGHIDFAVRKAIQHGLDPIDTLVMACLNPATYFRLSRKGAVAPGYRADLVATPDLKEFSAERVFKNGKLVALNGEALWQAGGADTSAVTGTVHFAPLESSSFEIPAAGTHAHVIGLIPHQLVTENLVCEVKSENGFVVSDTDNDNLKLAVVERHHATGQIGLGLVHGFGLQEGALATTVGHDSHNLIVVGTNDADMLCAARHLKEIDGGLAVVNHGKVLASLPLPIAGLMSDKPLEQVRKGNYEVSQAAASLGCRVENPFMILSFLALPVIPSLKLSDHGLVDVDKFRVVPLFCH